MATVISVEVVWAMPDRQELIELSVPAGSSIEHAIEVSGLYQKYPDRGLESADVGIWGQVLPRSHRVADGDRIEFYRPLQMDPREARRQRV